MVKIIGLIATIGGFGMFIIGVLSVVGLWETQLHPAAFTILGILFSFTGYQIITIEDDNLISI